MSNLQLRKSAHKIIFKNFPNNILLLLDILMMFVEIIDTTCVIVLTVFVKIIYKLT